MIDQVPDIEAARKVASLLVPDLNARLEKSKSGSMTIAQLCNHFEQSELCAANTWRSYSTKNIYKVYLKRWILPKWSEHLLSDIRTTEIESWLRSLPIARSMCAEICNVMSVLFNHACRHEFVDGNRVTQRYGFVRRTRTQAGHELFSANPKFEAKSQGLRFAATCVFL